jgi:hypothetical protein
MLSKEKPNKSDWTFEDYLWVIVLGLIWPLGIGYLLFRIHDRYLVDEKKIIIE